MKLLDLQISDDMLAIINEEVTRIKMAGGERTERDMLILEKAAKIYQILQSNAREAVKAGSFGLLPDADLKDSEDLQGAVDGSDSDDNL